jgi:hypothetical protein
LIFLSRKLSGCSTYFLVKSKIPNLIREQKVSARRTGETHARLAKPGYATS